MENTRENKERFFALYWGQFIGRQINISFNYSISSSNLRNIEDDYLELKSLSSISEEDAVEVAKILLKTQGKIYDFEFLENINKIEFDYTHGCDAEELISIQFSGTPNDHHKHGWKNADFRVRIVIQDAYNSEQYFSIISKETGSNDLWSYSHVSSSIHLQAYDFLRSKSYLVGYNGLVPEQILSYGWVRLTA